MEIEVKLDAQYATPKMIIYAKEIDKEIQTILSTFSACTTDTIVGYLDSIAIMIDFASIVRIYTENQKVFVQTIENTFYCKQRLYELESRLPSRKFLRISNSEIINLKQIDRLDFSFTGTIKIYLKNNTTVFSSRRYVSKIKEFLGL